MPFNKNCRSAISLNSLSHSWGIVQLGAIIRRVKTAIRRRAMAWVSESARVDVHAPFKVAPAPCTTSSTQHGLRTMRRGEARRGEARDTVARAPQRRYAGSSPSARARRQLAQAHGSRGAGANAGPPTQRAHDSQKPVHDAGAKADGTLGAHAAHHTTAAAHHARDEPGLCLFAGPPLLLGGGLRVGLALLRNLPPSAGTRTRRGAEHPAVRGAGGWAGSFGLTVRRD